MTAVMYIGDAIEVMVWQGPTGMFYAECPSLGMTQTHRGETLYDLARNVQSVHGLEIKWEAKKVFHG